MNEGYLKPRGPMGFRSTGALHTPEWEESNPAYAPPLVYVLVRNRESVRDSLKKLFAKPENE
jgi:hypothetical protein